MQAEKRVKHQAEIADLSEDLYRAGCLAVNGYGVEKGMGFIG